MKTIITTILLLLSVAVFSQNLDTVAYATGQHTVVGALPAYNVKDVTLFSYIDFIKPGYYTFNKPTYLTKIYSTQPGVIKIVLENDIKLNLMSSGNQDFVLLDFGVFCSFDYISKFRVASIETTQELGISYLRKK